MTSERRPGRSLTRTRKVQFDPIPGRSGNTIKMRLIKELEVSTPRELEEMLQNPLSRAIAEDFLSNDPTSAGIPTGRSGLEPGENVLEFIDRTSPFNVDTLPETTRTILVGIVPLPNGPLLSAASAGGDGGAGTTTASQSIGTPNRDEILFAVAGFRDDGDRERFFENLRAAGVPVPLGDL